MMQTNVFQYHLFPLRIDETKHAARGRLALLSQIITAPAEV
jgi:hypothetical protein